MYRGVGSVGIGSAPGGEPDNQPEAKAAAAFFVTYESLKNRRLSASPGLNHMLSASGAEFVSAVGNSTDRRYHV